MKVAVLLSGGVDSSLALRLLREEGHELTAFYLKVWLEDELSYLGDCPWEEDLEFARSVCAATDVPLEIRSLQKAYWDRVVRYTIDELRAGRTPSPDIFCNQRIKFGAFFDEIDDSYERVASGHYARADRLAGRSRLRRGVDPVKDQSYFLSHLFPEQLERALFPIGHLTKQEVRESARRLHLPTQNRKDSQGICFLGKIKYRDFVRHHLGERDGDIVDRETGDLLGQHHGYWFHTLGQRQGLGLSHGPWYVSGKDTESNVVYVSHAERRIESAVRDYEVENVHWLGRAPARRKLQVKLRHGPRLLDAEVEFSSEGRGIVGLERPESGVAPGQFTVFYDGEECLGGAKISAGRPSGRGGTTAHVRKTRSTAP